MLNRAAAFTGSVAGRIFLILLGGVLAAASVAALLSGFQRRTDLAAERTDRVADRAMAALENSGPLPGVRRLASLPAGPVVPALAARLQQRLPAGAEIRTVRLPPGFCAPEPPRPIDEPPPRVAGSPLQTPESPPPPPPPPPSAARRLSGPTAPKADTACFGVRLQRSGGAVLQVAIDAPPSPRLVDSVATPSFVVVLSLGATLLSLAVARMAARPVERLARAAERLAVDLDAEPVPVTGPTEVRQAMQAFNDMQRQLRRNLEERTYMLAAISHDLRSPLTRMRLRLETLEASPARDKLIADARAMSDLIEDGLELARASGAQGEWMRVDVAALVASLCEDLQDAGQPVTWRPSPRLVALTRPDALRRVIANLLDNAVRHGGGAEVEVTPADTGAQIRIADRGPGLAPEQLEAAFAPFRRLDRRAATGSGAGLGLTIAALLARRIGCSLALANREGGGLGATVTVPIDARPGAGA